MPALSYQRRTGNLCAASLYLGLAAAIENTPDRLPQRIGLYSYGSGCCSEFFSVVSPDAPARMVGDLDQALDDRRKLGWDEYAELLARTRGVLEAVPDRVVPQDRLDLLTDADTRTPFLAWTGTRSYHRSYAWV